MGPRYLNRQQLKRVNPFEGLMIDSAAWADAHRYHQDQQRLHALAMHHAGIVAGLEVTAFSPPDHSVVIHPGLAIDPEGNVILVTQAQRYYLQPKDRGLLYLIIEFREVATDRASYDGEQPTRIMEAYRIQQRETLPEEPHLELARVRIDAAGQPVRDPQDPNLPGPGEIDGRYRLNATVRPQGEISLGLLVPRSGGAPNGRVPTGLRNLARELAAGSGFRVVYRGVLSSALDAAGCQVVYMGGSESFSLDQQDLAALTAFLERGGVLMGEFCAEARGGERGGGFEIGFKVVAERIGSKLAPVARGHPLLDVRYPFATPPEGASGGGELLEGGGVIYSTLDYGCSWAGGHDGRLLPRSTIRDAMELGVNVAVYADLRRRRAELRNPAL